MGRSLKKEGKEDISSTGTLGKEKKQYVYGEGKVFQKEKSRWTTGAIREKLGETAAQAQKKVRVEELLSKYCG